MGSYRSTAAGTSSSESSLRTSPEKGEGSPSAAVLHTKQIKPRNSCALCRSVYVCTYMDLIHFILIIFLIISVTGRCFNIASILKSRRAQN